MVSLPTWIQEEGNQTPSPDKGIAILKGMWDRRIMYGMCGHLWKNTIYHTLLLIYLQERAFVSVPG